MCIKTLIIFNAIVEEIERACGYRPPYQYAYAATWESAPTETETETMNALKGIMDDQ